MTAPAFTPGPWDIGRGADGYPIVATAPDSISPSGQGVAHICKRAMTQEHVANARLIAAAPDMYEALKEAIGIIKIFHGPTAWDIYEKQSPEMKRFSAILAKVQS